MNDFACGDLFAEIEDEPPCCDAAQQSFECERTEFFDTLDAALEFAAPKGSTVRAVGYDRCDRFLRAGYRVTDGDADITIARGGEREFDTARRTSCKKLILVPTRDYALAALPIYRTLDRTFAVLANGQKPFAAVFDPDEADENLASIFGEILSLDLSAFDVAFGAYMRGERQSDDIAKSIAALVTELTAELKHIEKDRAKAKHALVRAGRKAARIAENLPSLPFSSGAAQTAQALRMLCAAEDRSLGLRGETENVLASYIIDFYIKSLTANKFEFPPDNGRRIDCICEYFHADLRRACVHASPIYPPEKLRLYEYRRDEFRAEQLQMLAALHKRREAAWSTFKRLYPDDGYSLKTLADKTDIGICLALAPDVFAADTMLSFLKQTGRLEKYII